MLAPVLPADISGFLEIAFAVNTAAWLFQDATNSFQNRYKKAVTKEIALITAIYRGGPEVSVLAVPPQIVGSYEKIQQAHERWLLVSSEVIRIVAAVFACGIVAVLFLNWPQLPRELYGALILPVPVHWMVSFFVHSHHMRQLKVLTEKTEESIKQARIILDMLRRGHIQ